MEQTCETWAQPGISVLWCEDLRCGKRDATSGSFQHFVETELAALEPLPAGNEDIIIVPWDIGQQVPEFGPEDIGRHRSVDTILPPATVVMTDICGQQLLQTLTA